MANCSCIMYGFFWFVLLVFIGWPISIFLSGLYGFLSPITTLVGLDDVSEALLRGVNLGRQCARNVLSGIHIIGSELKCFKFGKVKYNPESKDIFISL